MSFDLTKIVNTNDYSIHNDVKYMHLYECNESKELKINLHKNKKANKVQFNDGVVIFAHNMKTNEFRLYIVDKELYTNVSYNAGYNVANNYSVVFDLELTNEESLYFSNLIIKNITY